MFRSIKLSTKLFLILICVGLIPFSLIGIISLLKSSSALEKQAFAHLKSIRELKKNQVLRYFQNVENQIITFSENKMIIEAMREFRLAFSQFREENSINSNLLNSFKKELFSYYENDFVKEYSKQNGETKSDITKLFGKLDNDSISLQYFYIKANENPLGSKDTLNKAGDKSKYSNLHGKYHPIIRSYLKKFGYYDIFLIDSQTGDIVYSVFKELDYSTSLIDGPYADSNFGESFRLANAANNKDAVIMTDFANYFPSYEAPAGFIASPIFEDNQKIGVAIFQFPIDILNSIMTERSGMGNSGETYLVGSDNLMRSDSFLDPQNFSVAASFKHPSNGSVDTEATREALKGITNEKIVIDYNGNPVLSAYTLFKFRNIRWALLSEIDEAEAFRAVFTLKWIIGFLSITGIISIICLAYLITRSITKPIIRIIEGLSETSDQVSSASAQVSSMSHSLAKDTSEQASSLSKTGSALEEMSSMTKKSAENANIADNLMKSSKKIVDSANDSMSELTRSMNEISKASEETSKIISTIDEIAFQTNLLALNAAVEAARAGEAGTGFAVVADEVRNLAMRAAEAAKNTASLIEGTVKKVNDGSGFVLSANEAFKEVATSMNKIAQLVGEITTASKEQTSGIEEINSAVAEIDRITQQNEANAGESTSTSETMNFQAMQIESFVNELISLIRGA